MDTQDRSAANTRVVKRLGLAAVLMFGFGFAMVPLYDVFCEITGLNGKTGLQEAEAALTEVVDEDRLVTVEFLGVVHSDLPWAFRPMVHEVKVHPGEVTEVNYFATNESGDPVTGQAVPSVAPGQAAKYFSKTECFCFTRQLLEPGQGKEMPLRFVVDPALPNNVKRISLSYTFYQAKDDGKVGDDGKAGSLESIL